MFITLFTTNMNSVASQLIQQEYEKVCTSYITQFINIM